MGNASFFCQFNVWQVFFNKIFNNSSLPELQNKFWQSNFPLQDSKKFYKSNIVDIFHLLLSTNHHFCNFSNPVGMILTKLGMQLRIVLVGNFCPQLHWKIGNLASTIVFLSIFDDFWAFIKFSHKLAVISPNTELMLTSTLYES